MKQENALSPNARRSFFTRLNAGAAALAAVVMGGAAEAQVKPAARFEPARHDKDDWMDAAPAKHRMVFDSTGAEGLGMALAFAGNFIRTNRTEYGLQNSDSAVIVIARHRSAAFGFNDAMWAKYGGPISEHIHFEDPKTKAAAKVNVLNATDYGELSPGRGATLDSLSKQGAMYAVCSTASRALAGAIAKAQGVKTDEIFAELTSNLVANARMVPAGIVAVNRAQERGYTFVSC